MTAASQIQILRAVRDWNLDMQSRVSTTADAKHFRRNADDLQRRIAALREGGAS